MDYFKKAYILYKEAADLGLIAGLRGICKMQIVGDCLEKDTSAALNSLEKLKDLDEECSYLYSLMKSGDISLEDIVPNNEFYQYDEEDEPFDDPDR